MFSSVLYSLIVQTHHSSKMRGFMCHSVDATSVCTVTDPRSVITPRRPDRTSEDNHWRLISGARYSRLIEPHGFDPPSKRFVPSIKRDNQAVKPSLETIKQPHLLTPSTSLIMPSVKSEHQAVKPSMKSIRQPHLLSSSRPVIMSSVKSDQAVKPSMETIKQAHLPNSSDHVFQVVVMRVSLHCQGCAGKVKKHLSKMEGVTSFSIDLETKRVTVMGNISPKGVLESISKVKRAEFWTS